MANVSRDVLRHAIRLDEGSRQLHRERGLQPGILTTLVTGSASWSILPRDLPRPEGGSRIRTQCAARVGHATLSRVTGSPNTYGRTVFVNATAFTGDRMAFIADHRYRAASLSLWGRGEPYVLKIIQGTPDVPIRGVPKDSERGRQVIDAFMALTLGEIAFSSQRSPEAHAEGYRLMERTATALAQVHEREPLDGSVYYFNGGDTATQIAASQLPTPGLHGQTQYQGWINMNMYRVAADGWQLAATLNANGPSADSSAQISTYFPVEVDGEVKSGELGNAETRYAIALFQQLSEQPADHAISFGYDPTGPGILEQAQLATLETSFLPVSQIDLGPLNLG